MAAVPRHDARSGRVRPVRRSVSIVTARLETTTYARSALFWRGGDVMSVCVRKTGSRERLTRANRQRGGFSKTRPYTELMTRRKRELLRQSSGP